MEEAAAAKPIIGRGYCLPQAARFKVTKEDVTDSNGQLVFQVLAKSSTARILRRDGGPGVLLKCSTSFFGTSYKAYAFPVFKGRDQPLWRMKMKTSCLKGISFQIFLSSNVIQQVPDYTIKGYDGDDFYRKYTIYLEESRLAAEVTLETHKSFSGGHRYNVVVQPTMDTAFIFSLVITLDVISSERVDGTPVIFG